MIRHDTYGTDGTLARRIEVERTSADAAATTVWADGEGEQSRPASDREYEALVASEQGEATTAREVDLRQAITTLRQWADDARNINVTSTNAVAVLGTVVNRLGVFFDRFADLLVNTYGQE